MMTWALVLNLWQSVAEGGKAISLPITAMFSAATSGWHRKKNSEISQLG